MPASSAPRNPNATIARIIHHVWPGSDEFPREREGMRGSERFEFHRWRASWMAHHPDWSLRFWRLEPTGHAALDALLARSDLSPVVKSDVLRWHALYEHGGLYVDTDFECLQSFEPLLSDDLGLFMAYEPTPWAQPPTPPIELEPYDGRGPVLSPALIGCVRGLPFAASMRDDLLVRIESTSSAELNRDPVRLTGPEAVMRAVQRTQTRLTVYPSSHFHKEYIAGGEVRFATHHWSGINTRDGWARKIREHRPAVDAAGSPHFVVVHSPEERCGVGLYGRGLDRALACRASVVSTTFADDFASRVGAGDTLLAHFEPSLPTPEFGARLAEARGRGARVMLIAHHFSASSIAALAAAGDVVVVHRAAGAAPPARVVEIALGAPSFDPGGESREATRARFGLPPNAFVLMTLGFLTRWKRIPEMLDAILSAIASSSDRERFAVVVQTPRHYATDESEIVAATSDMHNTVRRHGIPTRVSTDFLSEVDLLRLVHASDLGFLFHGQHTDSVSAATKQFLAARTPLCVTESTHASDLGAWARRVPTLDAGVFARAVVELAGDAVALSAMRAAAEYDYSRLSMDAVAARLVALASEAR